MEFDVNATNGPCCVVAPCDECGERRALADWAGYSLCADCAPVVPEECVEDWPYPEATE